MIFDVSSPVFLLMLVYLIFKITENKAWCEKKKLRPHVKSDCVKMSASLKSQRTWEMIVGKLQGMRVYLQVLL